LSRPKSDLGRDAIENLGLLHVILLLGLLLGGEVGHAMSKMEKVFIFP
jgi:hypothetical protein